MPRKTGTPRSPAPRLTAASMRPRPDAAENLVHVRPVMPELARFNEAAARCRGKRPFTYVKPAIAFASMRPRPDAAENSDAGAAARGGRAASMRPRPDAAENHDGRRSSRPTGNCFNEAAARCRGKQPFAYSAMSFLSRASMRPRPDAAENVMRYASSGGGRLASMRPRPDAAENSRRR